MITDERLKEIVAIIRTDIFTYTITYEEKVVATMKFYDKFEEYGQ
jgi:hypothetical protein